MTVRGGRREGGPFRRFADLMARVAPRREPQDECESGAPSLAEPEEADDFSHIAEAAVGESVIYQRFSFTLGAPLHPEEVARRLLEKTVAVVAVDSLGEVLVGPSLAGAVKKLENMDATLQQLRDPTIGSLIRFGLRHPALAVSIVSAGWGHSTAESDKTSDDEETTSIRDMANGLRVRFGELAFLEGLASVIDGELLRPQFSAGAPWVRLSLPPLAVTHHASSEEDVLDVSLLVHRSGEAVMVFALVLNAESASVDLLNSRAGCSRPDLVRSRIDRRLLDLHASAMRGEVGDGEDIVGNGRPQVQFVHAQQKASLGEIFNVYREAVVYAVTGRPLPENLGEFLMMPLISVRGLEDALHAPVGRSLAMHYNTDSLTTSRARVSNRFVEGPFPHWAADVFLSSSCIVSLATDRFRRSLLASTAEGEEVPGQDWMYPEFALGLALDLALLRLRMVETFSERLSAARSGNDLNDAAAELLASYPEVSGDRLLRVGELSEVEQAVLDSHGFAGRRDAVLTQHRMSQELAVGRDSERVQRSTARTQGFVVVLTVLVAVLGSIGTLLQSDIESDWMPHLGDWAFDQWGPVVLVGLPVLVVAVLALWALAAAARRFGGMIRKSPKLMRVPPPPEAPAHRLPGGGVQFIHGDDDSE